MKAPLALLLLGFCLPAALLATSANDHDSFFTDEQTMRLIQKTCSWARYECPKAPYLSPLKPNGRYGPRYFDESQVRASQVYKDLKMGLFHRDEFIAILKEEFCCTSGPCKHECQVLIEEPEIVRNFAEISDKIFGLNLPELNEFKQHWIDYQQAKEQDEDVPAEIEELYDLLTRNEEKYMDALHQKEKQ